MPTRESFLTVNFTLLCTYVPACFLTVVSTCEYFFAFDWAREVFWVNTAWNWLFVAALWDRLQHRLTTRRTASWIMTPMLALVVIWAAFHEAKFRALALVVKVV